MCGFIGYCGEGDYDRSETIDKMSETIAHRGPDSKGSYVDDYAALGFRRLSIIDLRGGDQPIYSPDGRLAIVFNGEIYNYRELRDELIKNHNHTFKTDSDTEVLLHTYMEYGEKTASMLRGMFAFVIYDKESKSLYGARDYFGIKPFYYGEVNGTFFFGSEIKGFLPHPMFKKEIEPEIVGLFLEFQYSPLPQTIFKNIYKLTPGSYFRYDRENGFRETKYYDFSFESKNRSMNDAVRLIDDTVKSSVEYHKISDVEVGSFLSGGVDSSYTASVARPDKTFSVGFETSGFDETDFAKELCRELNMKNRKKEISPDEFFAALPKVQYYSDEPHANLSAVPLYYLSELAAKEVKVVLSGEGADELFGGYDWYIEGRASMRYRRLPLSFRKGMAKLMFPLPDGKIRRFFTENAKTVEDTYIGQAFIMSDSEANDILTDKYKLNMSYKDVTKPYYDKVKGESDLRKKMFLDMNLWLPGDILLKADKMTMAHSLELRVPYLDRVVFEVARTLTEKQEVCGRHTKVAFRKAALSHIPISWAERKKLGFLVPFRVWLTEEKYYLTVKEMFSRDFVSEFFDKEKINRLLDDHFAKKANNARKIYTIYSFLLWYEQYFDSAER